MAPGALVRVVEVHSLPNLCYNPHPIAALRGIGAAPFGQTESGNHMPYTMTTEPTFLRIVFSGAVTDRELQLVADYLLAIEQQSAITPHRLSDLSAMTEPYLTYPAIRALVERRKDPPIANLIKSALVAPRPIHRGLARMFQTLHKHPQIVVEIFATVEAAEAWLQTPPAS